MRTEDGPKGRATKRFSAARESAAAERGETTMSVAGETRAVAGGETAVSVA